MKELIKRTIDVWQCPICNYDMIGTDENQATQHLMRCEDAAERKALRQTCKHTDCRYCFDVDDSNGTLTKRCKVCLLIIKIDLDNISSSKLNKIWDMVSALNEFES